MQRERGKKSDKSKKEKSSGGRQNRWLEAGGAGSGKGRQTKKAEREQAEQQTGESKKVKRRSLGIKIDFLRFFTARPLHVKIQ